MVLIYSRYISNFANIIFILFFKNLFLKLNNFVKLVRRTVGQNRNHAAKNQKIDFFSFLMKLIPHYSKLFADWSLHNVLVLNENLRSYS